MIVVYSSIDCSKNVVMVIVMRLLKMFSKYLPWGIIFDLTSVVLVHCAMSFDCVMKCPTNIILYLGHQRYSESQELQLSEIKPSKLVWICQDGQSQTMMFLWHFHEPPVMLQDQKKPQTFVWQSSDAQFNCSIYNRGYAKNDVNVCIIILFNTFASTEIGIYM